MQLEMNRLGHCAYLLCTIRAYFLLAWGRHCRSRALCTGVWLRYCGYTVSSRHCDKKGTKLWV